MSALQTALEVAKMGYKVFPIIPNGKLPLLKGSWKEHATSDQSTITGWVFEHGDINFGLPTGSINNLIAIDLDSPAALHWAQREAKIPMGARIVTPRGGEHWVYSTSHQDIQTNGGKLHPDIDIRGEGGYIVLPGGKTHPSVNPAYGDGEYDGDMSHIPPLPDVVYELLPRRQSYQKRSTPPVGSKVVEPTTGEQLQLSRVIETLEELPRPWREGAFWDNTVFGMACWLWRMVRSPEYAITEDQALGLLIEHSPTDDVWTSEDILKKWDSASKSTEGEYADPPSNIPLLLGKDELVALINRLPSDLERTYFEGDNPKAIRSFIKGLHREGFSDVEARTLVFHCKPNNLDPDKKRSYWGLIQEIYSPIILEKSVEFVVPELDNPPTPESRRKERVTLLTDDERRIAELTPNFMEMYVGLAHSLTEEPNTPLHYLAGWQVLSSVLGGYARLTVKEKTNLALWGIHMADTASGKAFVKQLYRETVEAAVGPEGFSELLLGNDASEQALNRKLLEKGSGPSVLQMDEAHGWIAKFNNPRDTMFSGLQMYLTDIYDGQVRSVLKQGVDRKLEGKTATTAFNMFLLGTWDGFIDALDKKQIGSGFIGRFVPAIGFDRKITHDSLLAETFDPSLVSVTGVDYRIIQLGDYLAKAKEFADSVAWVQIPPDVNERWREARWKIHTSLQGHSHGKDLEGIALRTSMNALKCAGLLALSDFRDEIRMDDLLVALRSLEYWARDVILLVENINSNDYRKNIEAILAYIRSVKRNPSRGQILSKFTDLPARVVDDAIDRLELEGKIMKEKTQKGEIRWVALS